MKSAVHHDAYHKCMLFHKVLNKLLPEVSLSSASRSPICALAVSQFLGPPPTPWSWRAGSAPLFSSHWQVIVWGDYDAWTTSASWAWPRSCWTGVDLVLRSRAQYKLFPVLSGGLYARLPHSCPSPPWRAPPAPRAPGPQRERLGCDVRGRDASASTPPVHSLPSLAPLLPCCMPVGYWACPSCLWRL